MPQPRAGSDSLPMALFLPGLLRRERRAPSASRAARAFPTAGCRFTEADWNQHDEALAQPCAARRTTDCAPDISLVPRRACITS